MADSLSTLTTSIKDDLLNRIQQLSEVIKPIPTGYSTHLQTLDNIKAVIFDVYGTLLISASGDLGVAQKTDNENAFREALTASGISHHLQKAYIRGSDLLLTKIKEHHEKEKANGIQHPEVDIREIWKQIFESLFKSSLIDEKVTDRQLLETAIEYECRINPTWPMPDLEHMLHEMAGKHVKLGIVSNAQFYSPLLFEAYLGKDLLELGFHEDLLHWSYQQRIAKPSVGLYHRIQNQLSNKYDIKPEQVLYIGNDMLNDMMPSSRLGFKTALFAGDKRSLRLRENNEMCQDIKPDLVVDQLMQLVECIG